jgi:putative transposon-encoded protein
MDIHIMSRKVEVVDKEFRLTDKKVVAVLDRTVTPFGNSAKADVPRRYTGKRAYVVILE